MNLLSDSEQGFFRQEANVSDNDRDYFSRRAKAELEQTETAVDRRVTLAHAQMANAYLERIAGASLRPHAETG